MARVLRSPVFVAVLSSVLTASLFGVLRIAEAGPNEFYTGCLSQGELSSVRRGASPLNPCDLATQEVSWPSRSRTDMQVADLQGQVAGLEGDNAALQADVAALQGDVAAFQGLLADVTRDTDGFGNDRLLLTGMNLQVVNGTGTTDGATNGEGNVIVGYNTDNGGDTKTGSHSVIVGDDHTYTMHSTLVTGLNNDVTGERAAAVGGANNTASGDDSFVGGGRDNTANGFRSFVGGGDSNTASGFRSFVGGGVSNTASGIESFVGGGSLDTAGPGTCAWLADVNVVAC